MLLKNATITYAVNITCSGAVTMAIYFGKEWSTFIILESRGVNPEVTCTGRNPAECRFHFLFAHCFLLSAAGSLSKLTWPASLSCTRVLSSPHFKCGTKEDKYEQQNFRKQHWKIDPKGGRQGGGRASASLMTECQVSKLECDSGQHASNT